MSYQSEMMKAYPGWKPRKPEDIKPDYSKSPGFWFLQEDAACLRKKGSIMNELTDKVEELAKDTEKLPTELKEKLEKDVEEVKEFNQKVEHGTPF